MIVFHNVIDQVGLIYPKKKLRMAKKSLEATGGASSSDKIK